MFRCLNFASCIFFGLCFNLNLAYSAECISFYNFIKAEIPASVQEKFNTADLLAKKNAGAANFIRTRDHDGLIREIVFLNTEIVQNTNSKGTVTFDVRYNFLTRKEGKKIALQVDTVEWLQTSDANVAKGNFATSLRSARTFFSKAKVTFEAALNRTLDFTVPKISKSKVKKDSVQVLTDAGLDPAIGENTLDAIGKFDNQMTAWGLRKPLKTHVYIGRNNAFTAGVSQKTAVELRASVLDTKPTEQDQYLIVNSDDVSETTMQAVLRQRFMSFLTLNYNRDSLLQDKNSFIAKDPSLSNALADFVVAHVSNNPVIGNGERNIDLGQINGQSVIEVKDMARFGGATNSLLISKLLWDYRKIVGPEKMDQVMPRILWSLATLRSSYTEGELFRRNKGKNDADHYDYLRGKPDDRELSYQYEVDNLKYFVAALILANESVPSEVSDAVDTMIQERGTSFGFVMSSLDVKDRGAMNTIAKSLVPLIFPPNMKDYPALPALPAAPVVVQPTVDIKAQQ